MPSLNITFTDKEHEELKEAADRAGMSLKSYAHEAVVLSASSRKHQVAEAAKRVARASAELNRRLA